MRRSRSPPPAGRRMDSLLWRRRGRRLAAPRVRGDLVGRDKRLALLLLLLDVLLQRLVPDVQSGCNACVSAFPHRALQRLAAIKRFCIHRPGGEPPESSSGPVCLRTPRARRRAARKHREAFVLQRDTIDAEDRAHSPTPAAIRRGVSRELIVGCSEEGGGETLMRQVLPLRTGLARLHLEFRQ